MRIDYWDFAFEDYFLRRKNMYIKRIQIKSHGPIESLDYSFRFTDDGVSVPLVLIGRNGSGKTLLFASLVDSFVEIKRKLYPSGILEVKDNNYFKIGSTNYIKQASNTSKVYIECMVGDKTIKYLDVMSQNPELSISEGEVTDQDVINNRKFKDSGFYKAVNMNSITHKEFEKSILLYFPFDRFYKPMWYNPDNYNRISFSHSNYLGYSRTNLVKTDILENISDWLKNVYMQSQSILLTLPDQDNIDPKLRGKTITATQDTPLQNHLKQILSVIKGDGRYVFDMPTRNTSDVGIRGASIQCKDISQLSSGELILYSIALSIIKEWDITYNDDSVKLEDITGCVLIDEADTNLHIDFAYRALPALMKLFPKVQFIISTHSPFLLAGLKNVFDNDVDFLSLPTGDLLYDINSFSEITSAYEIFSQETNEALQKINDLKEENSRLASKNNKIVIYTEGKTDVEYLKLAFEKLSGFEDIKSHVEYYDIEHAKDSGDGELEKLYKYLQKGMDENIKIFLFDRDNPKYIFTERIIQGENRTYKFNIPTPPHRKDSDLISIEHCLTDGELKTVDKDGRRIFFAGEFDFKGCSLDGQYVCLQLQDSSFRTDATINPLEILSGANDKKKVFLSRPNETKNYALSKTAFVQHIIDGDPGFDSFCFEGFRPILEVIREIYMLNSSQTSENEQ